MTIEISTGGFLVRINQCKKNDILKCLRMYATKYFPH